MSNRTALGASNMQPGSHYAPYSTLNRRDSFQLGGQLHRPSTRSHSLEPRNESASITQSLIDAAAVAFWFLFIALVGVSITAAILILLFVVSF